MQRSGRPPLPLLRTGLRRAACAIGQREKRSPNRGGLPPQFRRHVFLRGRRTHSTRCSLFPPSFPLTVQMPFSLSFPPPSAPPLKRLANYKGAAISSPPPPPPLFLATTTLRLLMREVCVPWPWYSFFPPSALSKGKEVEGSLPTRLSI